MKISSVNPSIHARALTHTLIDALGVPDTTHTHTRTHAHEHTYTYRYTRNQPAMSASEPSPRGRHATPFADLPGDVQAAIIEKQRAAKHTKRNKQAQRSKKQSQGPTASPVSTDGESASLLLLLLLLLLIFYHHYYYHYY